MHLTAAVFIGVVAALHLYFLVLEMFLWDTPFGRKTFAMSEEQAAETKTLAGNQGLYNGFLVAGLVWSLIAADPEGYRLRLFFLGCVIVAGLYGAATVSRRILMVQALPAAIALALVLAEH